MNDEAIEAATKAVYEATELHLNYGEQDPIFRRIAIATITAYEAAREPVAWLYERGTDCQFHKTRQHYPGNWVEQMGYSVTPLYAAPGEHS